MKPRGTATEKLADVIQMLQIVRKTGLLVVQRNSVENGMMQGTLTFKNGQITDASIGALRGSEAFKKLTAWADCYFVFQPLPPSDVSPSPALPVQGMFDDVLPLTPEVPRGSANGYAAMSAVPYRIQQADEVLSAFPHLGLSRAHRQLFLLVDGKRSVLDLVRLIGLRSEAVFSMLTDLERAGLIRYLSM